MLCHSAILSLLAATALCQVLTPSTTAALNITAITASPERTSDLQCWQLCAHFATSNTGGIAGALALFLGDTANATFTVVPPRFDGGLHNAPARQFVYFTSGLAHVTLPSGQGEAWVQGGKYGLIYAEDTADVSDLGHRTEYPSAADTVALAFPVSEPNKVKHVVLYGGACRDAEITGL